MRILKSMGAAVAALSLVAVPVAASAAPAAKSAVSSTARAGAATTGSNKAVGSGYIIGALALAAIIAGIIIAADGNGNRTAVSR